MGAERTLLVEQADSDGQVKGLKNRRRPRGPVWSPRGPTTSAHAFASLLIAEGRLSIVEIAAQLGHKPTVCLDIYGPELAERTGAEGLSAEDRIWLARKESGRRGL